MRYRTITARYVAKWGNAQMCLCEAKCQGGGIGWVTQLTSLNKYCAIWRTAVIVSLYLYRDMGPLCGEPGQHDARPASSVRWLRRQSPGRHLSVWTAPKASHRKDDHLHFPRFDRPHFPNFPRFRVAETSSDPYFPRVSKPWFPNRGSRVPAEQR